MPCIAVYCLFIALNDSQSWAMLTYSLVMIKHASFSGKEIIGSKHRSGICFHFLFLRLKSSCNMYIRLWCDALLQATKPCCWRHRKPRFKTQSNKMCFRKILELWQYKIDSIWSKNKLDLKLSLFFTLLFGEWKSAAISKLICFSTKWCRSYIVFALVGVLPINTAFRLLSLTLIVVY